MATATLTQPTPANTLMVRASELIVKQEFNNRYEDHTPESIHQLASSILNEGLLHNLVVKADGDKYRVISGYRRALACQHLEAYEPEFKKTGFMVRVLVIDDAADEDSINIVENFQRQAYSPMDVAKTLENLFKTRADGKTDPKAYAKVLEYFGMENTADNRRWADRHLAILKLGPKARKAIHEKAIALDAGLSLLSLTVDDSESVVETASADTPKDRKITKTRLQEAAKKTGKEAPTSSKPSKVEFNANLTFMVQTNPSQSVRNLAAAILSYFDGDLSDPQLVNAFSVNCLKTAVNPIKAAAEAVKAKASGSDAKLDPKKPDPKKDVPKKTTPQKKK